MNIDLHTDTRLNYIYVKDGVIYKTLPFNDKTKETVFYIKKDHFPVPDNIDEDHVIEMESIQYMKNKFYLDIFIKPGDTVKRDDYGKLVITPNEHLSVNNKNNFDNYTDYIREYYINECINYIISGKDEQEIYNILPKYIVGTKIIEFSKDKTRILNIGFYQQVIDRIKEMGLKYTNDLLKVVDYTATDIIIEDNNEQEELPTLPPSVENDHLGFEKILQDVVYNLQGKLKYGSVGDGLKEYRPAYIISDNWCEQYDLYPFVQDYSTILTYLFKEGLESLLYKDRKYYWNYDSMCFKSESTENDLINDIENNIVDEFNLGHELSITIKVAVEEIKETTNTSIYYDNNTQNIKTNYELSGSLMYKIITTTEIR